MQGPLTIQRLLEAMKKLGASDLHLKVGIPPAYRINSTLRLIDSPPLTEDEADHLLDPIVPAAQVQRYIDTGNLDFATYLKDGDRFRVSMFRAGGHTHAAIRRVKAEIPDYKALHLPPIYSKIVETTSEGLVLVVGVTGSGKSSTLAAMIEHINLSRAEHIITVEDPVEYRFIPKKSIVSQREIGIDVLNYPTALKYIVREDPDVIFIGEMRDHETVISAIQAAETGHLVFGSMHTSDTAQSFSRMLEFFPSHERGFIRQALAGTMKAICAQRLLPTMQGYEVGVVPACEVLLSSPIVKEKIRRAEDDDLPAIVGRNEEGMQSFTYALSELVKQEIVARSVAMDYAPSREALDSMLKGLDIKSGGLVGRLRS